MWMTWSFLHSSAIHDSSASNGCVELIKTWMNTCDNKHEQCQMSQPASGPKRLLQIHMDASTYSVKLVKNDDVDSKRYTALSHCWGGSTGHQTTHENLHTRMKYGLNISDLPRSFQDAITITHNLDIHYILDRFYLHQPRRHERMGIRVSQNGLCLRKCVSGNRCKPRCEQSLRYLWTTAAAPNTTRMAATKDRRPS